MSERRKISRSPSRVPVDLYDLKGRMIVGEGRFLDLSESGARFESRKPLKRRSTIRVHLGDWKSSALELAARVVWARRHSRLFTYGLQFLRTAPPPAVRHS